MYVSVFVCVCVIISLVQWQNWMLYASIEARESESSEPLNDLTVCKLKTPANCTANENLPPPIWPQVMHMTPATKVITINRRGILNEWADRKKTALD